MLQDVGSQRVRQDLAMEQEQQMGHRDHPWSNVGRLSVLWIQEAAVIVGNCVVAVWLRSHVQHFVIPWTAARQAPLSSTVSWSLLKFMSTEFVMLSCHFIL